MSSDLKFTTNTDKRGPFVSFTKTYPISLAACQLIFVSPNFTHLWTDPASQVHTRYFLYSLSVWFMQLPIALGHWLKKKQDAFENSASAISKLINETKTWAALLGQDLSSSYSAQNIGAEYARRHNALLTILPHNCKLAIPSASKTIDKGISNCRPINRANNLVFQFGNWPMAILAAIKIWSQLLDTQSMRDNASLSFFFWPNH